VESSVLAVSHQPSVVKFMPHNWHEYQHVNSLRKIKKHVRSHKPSLILLCVGSEDDEQLGKDVAEYVRQGLSNLDTRLVLLRDSKLELDEATWMMQYQINACLVAEEAKATLNKSILDRELETFTYIENNYRQHDAETDMLMCITRFSRADENLTELLKSFSQTLALLCHSACSFQIRTNKEQSWFVEFSDYQDTSVIQHMSKSLAEGEIPLFLKQALREKHPQINLLHEDSDLVELTGGLPMTIGSYLTFPIVVYDNVVYLLLFLIPEDAMSKVSMKQINIINKAAEQLTILLERKQAENCLKKQYKRLQSTLLELKSTREELAHNEKMASIGRMAAGIAHEINNPLAYVISNISSMDKYLESIMQLQDMQTQLLSSIDIQQDQKAQQLKQHISQFEEEEDIPFVLEDIRAVVSDSFEGLQRVKNIITDLKSLSHKHQTQKNNCDINKVIEETLKIFKYDINDKVTIKQSINVSREFHSNSGLLSQTLTNLIKNAIQAMAAAKTEDPTININAHDDDKHLILSVKDNGPGIPEETRKKIFDPFFTTKPVGQGTGLGLSVSFNIINKLGGTLECTSEENAFTQFTIKLPLESQG